MRTKSDGIRALGGLVVGAALGAGCATAGVATGTAEVPGKGAGPAVLQWESRVADPSSGKIRARLPDGKVYEGTYFQITQDVTTSSLGPLWTSGWEPYWTGWGAPWSPGTAAYSATEFTTIYSGKVVASLDGPGTDAMRCRFTLRKPTEGLEGGGFGECQTKSGAVIEDAVLAE